MKSARARRARAVLAAAGAAITVAVLGGLATDLSPWYYGLAQPAWKPPDWVFAPAWTIIFAAAALAGLLAWERAPDRGARESLLALFALNGFLNLLWSLLFFRLRRPDWALVEVVFLWLSVLALLIACGRRSRLAGALLAPYLLWVAFAAALNFEVVRLNRPF